MDGGDKMKLMRSQNESIVHRHMDVQAENSRYRDRKDREVKDNAEMGQYMMTGRERIQYRQWKAEREDIDEQRMSRQQSHAGGWAREWDQSKGPLEGEPRQPKMALQESVIRVPHPHQNNHRMQQQQLVPLAPCTLNLAFEETRMEFVGGRGRARNQAASRVDHSTPGVALDGKQEIVSGRGRGRRSKSPIASPGINSRTFAEVVGQATAGTRSAPLQRRFSELDSIGDEFSGGLSNWADLPTPTSFGNGPPTFQAW